MLERRSQANRSSSNKLECVCTAGACTRSDPAGRYSAEYPTGYPDRKPLLESAGKSSDRRLVRPSVYLQFARSLLPVFTLEVFVSPSVLLCHLGRCFRRNATPRLCADRAAEREAIGRRKEPNLLRRRRTDGPKTRAKAPGHAYDVLGCLFRRLQEC